MLKSISNLAAAICAVAAAAIFFAAPASAKYMEAMKVSPATNAFGGPVIEVESDGEEWTRIKPASHELKVKVDIRSGSGWRVWSAYIGVPSADFGGTSNSTDAIRRLGGGKDTKSITRTETHTFHTNDLTIDALGIMNLCNGGGGPATQERTEFTDIGVGIKAYFQTRREAKGIHEGGGDDAGRSEYAYTRAPVTVRCLAGPSRVGAAPKPVSVDIRLKQKGDTCPKDADVTAYIDYEVPMVARFRVIHNGVEPKSAPIEIKARKVTFAGKTWYRVERMQRYKLDPGKHSFQITVIGGGKSPKKTITVDCPPFKVTSIWLSYEVENKQICNKKVTEKWAAYTTRPGDFPFRVKTQGGLVVSQGIAYASREGDKYVARRTRHLTMGAFDQMMRVEVVNDPAIHDQKPLKIDCLEVLSGTLQLREFAASRCEGEAAFSIRTNMPGDVPYRFDCTGGRTWSGTVKAHNTGPGTYIGVATKRFDVANNEQVNCALKTRKPFPVKILALRGNKYACHRSTVDTGSDDLAPNPGQQPDPPPVGRKLAGDFSFIDNGGSRCERQGSALINFKLKEPTNVHFSLDCTNGHFSGVAQTVSDGKGGYVAPALVRFDIEKTTHAKCALKSVAPGKPKVHALKGHLFRCVIPEIEPGANDLVNDPRPPSAPAGSGPGRIVDPVRIACHGGVVRNRACYCPRTHKKTQTGPNEWRCDRRVVVDPPRVPPSTGPGRIVDPVRITCLGGAVRNRSCYCPRTHKRMQISRNVYRCDRKVVVDPPRTPPKGPGRIVDPVRITCLGGAVRNRSCYCPRTHKRVQIGRNAYRCVMNMVVVPPKRGGSSAATGGKRKIAVPPKRRATPKRRSTGASRSMQLRTIRGR